MEYLPSWHYLQPQVKHQLMSLLLIDQKLDAVYGCVQGGHAVAQWLLEHPNQEWNNSYLIYLYADLDKWKVRLDLVNKDYSSFYEPDLGNQLTAIACSRNLN